MSIHQASKRWVGLGVLVAGLSMIVLDGTVVGVALPSIITDLGLHLTDAQWVTSLYSVVFAALLLVFGRLGDRWGRRNLFVAGVAIFVAASLWCALAKSGNALIAARAVQGLGGAMVLPSTLSTVNATFRGKDRAVAFGIWGAVMAGMAAIGPLLGAWLTSAISWRWIFLINLPIGITIVALAYFFVDESRGETPERGADVGGFLASSIALGLLVFGLIEGTSLGWWKPRTGFEIPGFAWPQTRPLSLPAVAILVGLFFLVLFLLWERHRLHNGRSRLLDLSLFALPTFSWGNLTAAMVATGEFALVFVLPLYLVNVSGLSIMAAGWVLAAMALGAFFSGASARHLAARMGASRAVVLGLVLEMVGAAGVGIVVWQRASSLLLSLVMIIYGIGLGIASAQLTSLVLHDVPTGQSGSGSATQSTARQLGTALGSALSGTVLAARLSATLPDVLRAHQIPAPAVDGISSAVIDSAGGALHKLGQQLDGATIKAIGDSFAHAAAWSVGAAVVFLLLGLLGSVQVMRASQQNQPTPE